MAEKELKWRDIFLALLGIILSFADPITDILTLVEFYHAGHKTWFGVGLAFIIAPCASFGLLTYCKFTIKQEEDSFEKSYLKAFLFGFNPFSPAVSKVVTLISDLKKLWRGNQIQPFADSETTDEKKEDAPLMLEDGRYFLLFEAAFESAPQFIIELYVVAAQQNSVTIVQKISLSVSFLSLAWGAVVCDEVFHYNDTRNKVPTMKKRLLHFATHLFVLSSRLTVVALFTVSYKWWIAGFIMFHIVVIFIYDAVWAFPRLEKQGESNEEGLLVSFLCFTYLHWLRDDTSMRIHGALEQNRNKEMRKMMLFSNVLFVIEDITMTLLFYLSHFPHTWYSLPVTICVCVFAVLGAIMRLTHFYFLTRERHYDVQENP